ncbi:HAMP domain-containing histidine kinase [Clostridium botulinum]|uniref:histidine kinase n=4 Tax=Clostridium botulinum TaxID=1491 RepID=A0A846I0W1_CLOBO|nr:HAMP domain-containing sensor histidine kinase [Clostridium botulinum]AJD26447.1 his Kinase A domain protein [Clostridium botulinum CDC_297]ACQ53100.1 sensor histidine kinase [Clostridium botulinum Ba4 str. 657]AJE11974.1 his Kinase A domain protein [Clostridium botulinum CDC_1436]APR01321.1 his Kinase A domain protein [Clostridium botulinum]APU60005.1 his Kinase A domain protein [Clostridium botulinum]
MENISTVIIKEQQEVIKKFLPIRFILINAVIVFIYVSYVKSDLKSFCIFNIAMVEGIISNNMLYGFSSRDMKNSKNKFNSKYNNKTKIYKNFINNIISPIIILKDEKIYFMNDEAKKYIKIKKNINFNNINIYDYLEEKFYKEGLLKIDNIKNSTGITYLNEKIILKNGEILKVDLRCFVLDLNGEEFVSISIKNNVLLQENKKLYEELEKNKVEHRQRAEFYANISHDLKTPINIIYSAIQVMNMALDNKKIDTIEKYIGVIKQNCYRLLRLVNNIVNTNKIESGCCKIKLNNNNIVSLVEDIVTSVSTYVENNDMDIIFDTDTEEKIIACDKDMIERVVLNLISNSVKYKQRGKGSIQVTVQDKEDRVIVSVKDNGIGIPENIQKNVFNRFVQSNRKEYDLTTCSSGIGLALVKSIIDMHDGNIQINSRENKGTEIIFELPSRKVKENEKCKEIYTKNIGKNVKIEFPEIYDSAI